MFLGAWDLPEAFGRIRYVKTPICGAHFTGTQLQKLALEPCFFRFFT